MCTCLFTYDSYCFCFASVLASYLQVCLFFMLYVFAFVVVVVVVVFICLF